MLNFRRMTMRLKRNPTPALHRIAWELLHDDSGFRSITEAQREVFALHEIAQTIGSSLNLNDTVTLVSNKLQVDRSV